jgi:origin recognition complex subunit 4
MEDEDVVMEEEEENPVVPPVPSLPPKAQPRMLTVLETLTGQERQPAPLPDEESNEALQGVVSLLRGTVERGEGNSALVTGPRGAGKTRVRP